MIAVKEAQFVLKQVDAVRSASRMTVTNYFLSEDILDRWIRTGTLFHEEIGGSVFLFKKDADFFHLFFVSPAQDELGNGLAALSTRLEILACDVITKTGERAPLLDVFEGHGFSAHNSLMRMRMTGDPGGRETGISEGVRPAAPGEAGKIHELLCEHFDRFAEQIPGPDEIADDAGRNRIIVAENGGRIAGLIHFDLTGLTSHLRRWFVHPDFRDQHVGSRLLRSYFFLSRGASRFILWVLRSNANAIDRYRHYGYRDDDLIDTIFINYGNTIRHGR